jgi:multisubunit Na+/H+ antiporter MnhG subunit
MKRETVHCHDTTGSCFVAKVRNEVFARFHVVTAKSQSGMRNCLFGLSGRIIYELPLLSKNVLSILLIFLFTGFAIIGLVYCSCFLSRTLV